MTFLVQYLTLIQAAVLPVVRSGILYLRRCRPRPGTLYAHPGAGAPAMGGSPGVKYLIPLLRMLPTQLDQMSTANRPVSTSSNSPGLFNSSGSLSWPANPSIFRHV